MRSIQVLSFISIFFITGLLLSSNNAQAQTSTKFSSADVTLNVILEDAASLTLGTGANIVNLKYSNMSDYDAGVEVTQRGALIVKSTGSYTLTVHAASDLKSGTNTIPVSNVSISPKTTKLDANLTLKDNVPIPVGAINAAQVAKSSAGSLNTIIDLTYSTRFAADPADFLNKPIGTYTTTLTYTLTRP